MKDTSGESAGMKGLLRSLPLYYQTLRHLTGRQIAYRLYYPIRNRVYPSKPYALDFEALPRTLGAQAAFPLKQEKWLGTDRFRFLNLEKAFEDGVDWEFPGYGKLWTYNLNYFDCLMDESITETEAFGLMHRFLEAEPGLKVGKSPYPVSLRIFNWVKAMVRFGRTDPRLLAFVRCELRHLTRHLEFHVLGNHLLENALALCFGSLALGDRSSLETGLKLLGKESAAQILDDGGHQERSPMYQQILLERMLDCVNLSLTVSEGRRILEVLQPVVESMFAWLRGMTFSDGRVACMNDAAPGVSMSTLSLKTYSISLGLDPDVRPVRMGASGYRRFDRGGFECIVDAGDVGPDHLLAHAHSDTLSFCLHHGGKAVIVDTGTSTYEEGEVRQSERSTRAHNTVMVDGREQSVAWSSFRVARRAHARILDEGPWHLRATHDGYAGIGAEHVRSFRFEESRILIEDRVLGGVRHEAFLHFAPDIEPRCLEGCRIEAGSIVVEVQGAERLVRERYSFAEGFNRRKDAWRVRIPFQGALMLIFEPS